MIKKSLQELYPEIAKEWHPTKNGLLTPEMFSPFSHHKAWWKCKKNHEWQDEISLRSMYPKCPYCSHQRASKEYNLKVANPILAKQWHSKLNEHLTPEMFTPRSGKEVWWICKNGHEWKAPISNRMAGRGCARCSGRIASKGHNLQELYPEIAKEWHPTLNGKITPFDVSPMSNKTVWWKCKEGHEWDSTISNRTSGRGCPDCGHRRLHKDNCLETVNPELTKEWHPALNKGLLPSQVISGSAKMVWWLCKRGHKWQATVNARNDNGIGCPQCSSRTSKIELRIYTELKYLFKNTQHRKIVYGVECDVYIPDLKLAVEVDGYYWHKNKSEKDKEKVNYLSSKGVLLLRLREKGLTRLFDNDIFYSGKEHGKDYPIVEKLLLIIKEQVHLNKRQLNIVNKYISNKIIVNEKEYHSLMYMLPAPFPGQSLADLYPELAKGWHPTMNGSMTPSEVSAGSNIKVWWLCKNNHPFQMKVKHRVNGHGCSYCTGQRAMESNCLATVNPELAKEWHPTLNGKLTPRDVKPGSGTEVWWLCKEGHEWKAIIYGRNKGHSCIYCCGQAVNIENCLATKNPILSREWHPTKNGKLTPKNVTSGSGKRVWWKCKNGHEWQAQVCSRNKGAGCRDCYNLRKHKLNT